MSWLSDIFCAGSGDDGVTLLKLRTTRFRQLLRSYGTLLALLDDAAEKQGGGFVLDRQYVVALVERVAELADAVVFDFNVLTSQQNLAFYEAVDHVRSELRTTLAQVPGARTEAGNERNYRGAGTKPAISSAALASALSRAEVLFSECGQVARRGVAAGPVCNLDQLPAASSVAPGSVLVARDLTGEALDPALVKGAGAILLERGSAAGAAARLARELHIPAIVGLQTVSARLASGTEVTVDADDNVVYLGRIAELVEYYRAEQLAAEEEPEYHLLRRVRRAVFPLTLPPAVAEPTLSDCRTLRDVVHLAHSLAGDALVAVLGSQDGWVDAGKHRAAAPSFKVSVSHLDGSADRDADGSGVFARLQAGPLRIFLDGLESFSGSGRASNSSSPLPAIHAAARGEHIVATATFAGGFDLLDATAGDVSDANTVYCRFAPRGANDPQAVRGELAIAVLARFGFELAVTGREVSGWIHTRSRAQIEECICVVGRLFASLGSLTGGDVKSTAVESFVEEFMRGWPQGVATADSDERTSGGMT